MKKKQNLFEKTKFDRWILKILLNFWSVIALILFIADFASQNLLDSAASAVGVIYVAILGIYVSEKEYVRWKDSYKSNYLGESFVVLWTIVMALFVILAPVSGGYYRIPEEFALVYTSIIGIFAISRQSRNLRVNKPIKPLPKKK